MTTHSRAFLWRLALLLAGLSMFGPFAIDAIFPAFPELQAQFGVSHAAVQQSISVYLIAYALMSVFHGPVSDAVGRRPVILVGVAVFVLACVGAAQSQSLFWLLVFRALQGISAGAGLIVGRALIRDCLEGDAAQRLMAQATMIFSIAPAIAPIVGGWILGWTSWHGIFWAMAIFSSLVFIACLVWLPETHPLAARTRLRIGSLARGSWAILGNRRFLLLAMAACFNFGALFIYIVSAPAVVLDHLQLNQQQFGWLFVPIVVGLMIGSLLSSRLAGRLSQSATAKLGFGLSALAALSNLIYNLVVDQAVAPWAVLSLGLSACGIGLVFPLLTIAMLDMYPRQRGMAASMQAFTGLTFNAVLAGAVAPLLAPNRLGLAVVALAMCAAAIGLWWRYRLGIRREPSPVPSPQLLDGAERL
ncbi:multidrug effflux MFS transporter [Xanthomonadaceae bacterium JHOS43]|nr:multidrug effflux MFS transporter [Xanthomonadaceae bacterium JHOS43]